MIPYLQHLRQSGTKVAVVSNSMPFFVRIVLKAAFSDAWESLFDLVVARSSKPSFFGSSHSGCSFLHPESQAPLCLSSCQLNLVFGGNDVELLDFMNPKDASGDCRPNLFVGDSITHDVISPSSTGRWQAAAIVEEVLIFQAESRCHPLVLPPDGFPSMCLPQSIPLIIIQSCPELTVCMSSLQVRRQRPIVLVGASVAGTCHLCPSICSGVTTAGFWPLFPKPMSLSSRFDHFFTRVIHPRKLGGVIPNYRLQLLSCDGVFVDEEVHAKIGARFCI